MDVWIGEHRVGCERFTLGFAGHAPLSAARAEELLRDPLLRLDDSSVSSSGSTVTLSSPALTVEWTLSGDSSQLAVTASDAAATVQALEALAPLLAPSTVTLAAHGAEPCSPVEFMQEGVLFVRHVVDVETPFQRIQVGEHPLYGKVLFLNGEAQIASSDEHVYSEAFVGGAYRPGIKRAMILGGGDCGVIRELLTTDVEHVLMIEIDEQVVKVCAEHFPEVVGDALTNARATIQYGDAFAYLRDEAEGFDLIVYDLSDTPLTFGDYGPVLPLIKKALAPGGRVAMQCGPGTPEARPKLDVVLEALREEFSACSTREVDVPSFIQRPWVFAYGDAAS